jgi:hypothetical protein
MHYGRWRTHGDPEKLTPRKRAAWREPVGDDEPGRACSTCKRRLAVEAFSKSAGKPDGLAYRCKDCCRTAYNERYRNDPSFREQRAEYTRQHYEKNAEKRRTDRRKNLNRYGITTDDFEKLLESQHGVCAICGDPPKATNQLSQKTRLAVDHDHETGRVRGLLCDKCNTGLGQFKDDPVRLMSAINYLEKHD